MADFKLTNDIPVPVPIIVANRSQTYTSMPDPNSSMFGTVASPLKFTTTTATPTPDKIESTEPKEKIETTNCSACKENTEVVIRLPCEHTLCMVCSHSLLRNRVNHCPINSCADKGKQTDIHQLIVDLPSIEKIKFIFGLKKMLWVYDGDNTGCWAYDMAAQQQLTDAFNTDATGTTDILVRTRSGLMKYHINFGNMTQCPIDPKGDQIESRTRRIKCVEVTAENTNENNVKEYIKGIGSTSFNRMTLERYLPETEVSRFN